MKDLITKTNRGRKNHMVFSTKFRTDDFVQKYGLMSPDHWSKYKELIDAEKKTYFIIETPVGETIPSVFDRCDKAKVIINVPIIYNFIKTFYISDVRDTGLRSSVVQIV